MTWLAQIFFVTPATEPGSSFSGFRVKPGMTNISSEMKCQFCVSAVGVGFGRCLIFRLGHPARG